MADSFKIKKLPTTGVEVLGLDLYGADPATIRQIPALLAEHLIVVFREQTIPTPSQVESILSLWGRQEACQMWCRHEETPMVMRVTNQKVAGSHRQGLFPEGEMKWHLNGPFMPYPEEGLMLLCVRAGVGGATSFLNMQKAFDALPGSLKNEVLGARLRMTTDIKDTILGAPICRISDSQSLFELNNHRTRQKPNSDDSSLYQSEEGVVVIEKPLCMNHPVTGKLGLSFPFYYVSEIVELQSNRPMIEIFHDLKHHLVEHPEFVYEHHWEKGDIVLSDQIFTLHKRSDFQGTRELWRSVFWYN